MILNMGASSKKKAEANLQNDAVLGELLGQIKSSTKSEAAKKPVTMHQQQQRPLSSAKPHQNPFAVRPTSTGLKKVVKKEEPAPVPIVDDGPLSQLIEEEPEFESAIDEPTPTQIIGNAFVERYLAETDEVYLQQSFTKKTMIRISKSIEAVAVIAINATGLRNMDFLRSSLLNLRS